jgi:hypothetical protein
MKKTGNKKNVEIKEEEIKNNIAMPKETRRQQKKQQKTNKERKPVHPIKEMNEKKLPLEHRLRIKLQKDNTEKQPAVPEERTYNSRSKYDR